MEEGGADDSGGIVRLTPGDTPASRSNTPLPPPVEPAEAPAERLPVAPKSHEERRTHEPTIDALIEVTAPDRGLEETWSDEIRPRPPTPWGWFVLVGLLVATAVVWSLVNQAPDDKRALSIQQQSIAAVENDAKESAEAEARVERILAAVRAFAAADSPEKLEPLVRFPERVKPLLSAWHADHPVRPDPFSSLEVLQPTYDQSGSFWVVGYRTKSGARKNVMVEELPDKRAAIDWESAVSYQPLDWTRYALDRPPGSFDFRVRISPDNLYSHEFTDSNRWMSFKLVAQESEETLFGYADRRSGLADELISAFQKNNYQPVGMILRISVPTGLKSPRGVIIEQIRSPHPVYLAAPEP